MIVGQLRQRMFYGKVFVSAISLATILHIKGPRTPIFCGSSVSNLKMRGIRESCIYIAAESLHMYLMCEKRYWEYFEIRYASKMHQYFLIVK